MKNQYFGDVNDYQKYGLLRAITAATGWSSLVAWYLTPDDGRTDGGQLSYLLQPGKWRACDPDLYDFLHGQVVTANTRCVAAVEQAGILARTTYFSTVTPDGRAERAAWFRALRACAGGRDLVFLDPDNGLEIKSRPVGSKDSSKYALWEELASLWEHDTSLLVYQHFPRRERTSYIAEVGARCADLLNDSRVTCYRAANVLFLLALQPRHQGQQDNIGSQVAQRWAGRLVAC